MILNYTFADFLAEVQTRLNEPATGGLWTEAELNTLINIAYLRVAMDTRIIKSDNPVTITPNFSLYTLPVDNLIPEYIYCDATYGFKRLFPTNLLSMDKTAEGFNYWEKSTEEHPRNYIPFSINQVILTPPPNASANMTLHYVPYPIPLVNPTDTTPYPLSAQRLVPIFATYLAQMKNDVAKAVLHLSEYKKRVLSVQEQKRNSEKDRPASLVPGRRFDKQHANPETGRFIGLRGYGI